MPDFEQMEGWLEAAENERNASRSKPHTALRLLRRLEWAGNEDYTECPSCRRMQWKGHQDGCELAALLGEED